MHKLFTFLLLHFFAQYLFAQQNSQVCYDFENISSQTVYGFASGDQPGDIILQKQGATVSLAPFTTGNGSSNFFVASVQDNPFDLETTNVSKGIYFNSLNFILDISNFERAVNQVSFDFINGEGVVNLSVNRQLVRVINQFSELGSELEPGISINLEAEIVDGVEYGRITLEGDIQSIVLGGENLFIDNLCGGVPVPRNCTIQNLDLEIGECLEEEKYAASLDFQYSNASNNFFDIYLNGELLVTETLTNLPLELELPYLYDERNLTLEVCIGDDAQCCEQIGFTQPSCDFTRDCAIEILDIYPTNCDDNGEYLVNIFVINENGSEAGYFIEDGEGNIFGPTPYGASVVILGPYTSAPNSEDTFTVRDAVDENCAATQTLLNPCNISCTIDQLLLEAQACDEFGEFMVNVTVNASHGSAEGFYVTDVFGESFGPFRYEDAPITLGPYTDLGDLPLTFTAIDATDSNCKKQEELFDVCNHCRIEEVAYRLYPCDDNGQFSLELEVTSRHGSATGFFVSYLEERFGPFSYSDAPITISSLSADDGSPSELLVYDAEDVECIWFDTVHPPCGTTCNFNVFTETTVCNEDNQFYVEVAAIGGNEAYFVEINDINWGPFPYGDQAQLLGPFESEEENFAVVIHDTTVSECKDTTILQAPCLNNNCSIAEAVIEPLVCDEEQSFHIRVMVRPEHPSSENYEVDIFGQRFGPFSYADPFALIGPFDGTYDALYEITIFDSENESCSYETTFESPCRNCSSIELTVEPLICQNNQFDIDLSIIAAQPSGEGYFIQVDNGEVFGPFSYQQQLVTIGPFEGDGATIHKIIVIDSANQNCKKSISFTAVDCASQCNINDLLLEIGESCNEDSTFPLMIDFNVQNPVGTGYAIYVDDQLLGSYSYSTIPLYLPNFNALGKERLTIAVVAGNDLNCAVRKILETPECSRDTTNVWPGDTDNNGIANYIDLLNIGLAHGSTGPTRLDNSIDWYGRKAPSWTAFFRDGTNYKHADANGDGVVDDADLEVLDLNYGNLREGLTEPPISDGDTVIATVGDPSIFVDLPESGEFPNGSAFSFPVILGSENQGVESVYGVAFTIEYNPSVLDPNTLKLTIPDSWLGNVEDLLIIQRHYPERGLLEVAISRKNGEPVTGSGAIALMTTIIADLVGFSVIEVGVKQVKAIRVDGFSIPILPETRIAKIIGSTTATNDWEESGLSIYPNPIKDVLYIENESNEVMERIEILNPRGKVMKVFIRPESSVLLSDLPLGLYLLKVQLGDHFYHTQIIKQ